MRSTLSALVLIIALAPAVEALAGAPSYGGCGSPYSHGAHDADDGRHADHESAVDELSTSPDAQDQCGCGCDCGPAHGCTPASTAVTASTGALLFFVGALAPATCFQPLSSRFETPLYRPPISQPAI